MKVLFLSNPNSTHTMRWVSALSERGVEVFLYSFRKAEDEFFYSRLKNVRIESFREDVYRDRSSVIRLFCYYIPLIMSIHRIWRREKPDVVNANYISNNGLFAALSLVRPLIVTAWGSDVFFYPKQGGIIRRWLTKLVLWKADKLISSSHVMAEEMYKYVSRYKKIAVVPFGVDCDCFKPDGKDKSVGIVIGTVKSLKRIYRIDMLIEAFAIVVENIDTQLMIVGGGEEVKNLKRLARKLGIGDKVYFMGAIQNYDLPPLYNAMDIFVSLSKFESFGVSTIEAMACELPVVSSDAPGFKEVMIDGKTGVIVGEPTAEKVAAEIKRLIDDVSLRKQMGKIGRERVLQLYDWNKNVDALIGHYKDFC